ncbi:hypothetical protein Tco_1441470, partial [Tanacetum coccineum]
ELANFISIQGPRTRQRRRSQLTIDSQIDDVVVDTYAEKDQKKPTVAREGSSNAHNKHYADSDTDNDAILYSSCLNTSEESANENDDADDFDMDLSDDNPQGNDDATGFAVQARVLTEIKKILPNHIPTAFANYVKPRLNTSVLEVHDNQDLSNNREWENKKKRRKDVGEPSSKSSRQNKSHVVRA